MRRLFIFLVLFLAMCLNPGLNWAKNRTVMIDTTTLANVTGVSKWSINGVDFFSSGYVPGASEFLIIDSDGQSVTGFLLTSSVTGSGGVNLGEFGAIAYYGTAGAGATVYPLSIVANAVVASDSSGSPYMTATLPTAVMQNISILGALSQGLFGTTGFLTSNLDVGGTLNVTGGVSGQGENTFTGGVSAGQVSPTSLAAQAGATLYTFNNAFNESYENQSGAGAAGITVMTTFLHSPASGNTMVVTLESAATGQVKKFVFISDGGDDIHVTPTNLRSGTTLWFTDAGYGATLVSTGDFWDILTTSSGVTIQ